MIHEAETGDYLLHFSASHAGNGYGLKAIYYCRTRDFIRFSEPELLYRKADSGCIDSAMVREDGRYYLFVKSEANPQTLIELTSACATGPFRRVTRFDQAMASLEPGQYEAPAVVRLEDGRWGLFIDYYGRPGQHQGYVPFLAHSLAGGEFIRSDAAFSFPYGFKHGTILAITDEEYLRMRGHDWEDVPDMR